MDWVVLAVSVVSCVGILVCGAVTFDFSTPDPGVGLDGDTLLSVTLFSVTVVSVFGLLGFSWLGV